MTAPTSAIDDRFVASFSNHAVLAAVERVRAVNEEIDPEMMESEVNGRHYDRRRGRRIHLRMPITLIPVSEDSTRADVFNVCGAEQIAMTRDLSSQGLGILHDVPLLADFAIVQFDIPGDSPIQLLYEIRWSVRKTQFSYMSGGRLTGVASAAASHASSSS